MAAWLTCTQFSVACLPKYARPSLSVTDITFLLREFGTSVLMRWLFQGFSHFKWFHQLYSNYRQGWSQILVAFGTNTASETISEYLILKIFMAKHSPDPYIMYVCEHTYLSLNGHTNSCFWACWSFLAICEMNSWQKGNSTTSFFLMHHKRSTNLYQLTSVSSVNGQSSIPQLLH